MKILITQDTNWLERNPGQQHHLADRLWQRGHDVRVIDYDILWKSKRGEGWRAARLEFNHVWKTIPGADVTVIRPTILRMPGLHYLSMFFTYRAEIKRQLVDFKPQVVIGHSVLSNYLSMKLSRKAGVPFVFHMTDAQHTIVPNRILSLLAKRIERRILKRADRILVINEKLRDYSVRMGADPSKVEVIRAGIDLARYNSNVDGSEIRREFNIDREDLVLFFMGWLYKFSGLIEVAKDLLKDGRTNIKFLVVGDGDAFEELHKIHVSEDAHNVLVLTGKQPFERIPEFVASANICLLPAYNNETMRDIVPIKMYEYMAMAKPVISTDLPGVRNEFGEGHGVHYVKGPKEVLRLAIQMHESGIIDEEGKKARAHVQGISWTKAVDDFERNLRDLVQREK